MAVEDVRSSAYDEVAGFYHTHWADWYLPGAMPALEKVFFSNVRAGARVLDVCCGSGHVTRELVRRGYIVTGVDSSAELIAVARRELPTVDFRVQDARALRLDGTYQAALSTFDSLNHMMTVADLRDVFAGVHRILDPGGLFVFDMNLELAYTADLRQWNVNVAEDDVTLVRGLYDFTTKIAETELIWFVRGPGDCWKQHRSIVEQRCYPSEDILRSLREAGFQCIEARDAQKVGVTTDLGFGRIFVSARA